MEKNLIILAALPFGPPWDFASTARHMFTSGLISEEKLREIVGDLANSSSNPVILQNLLSLSLQLSREEDLTLAESLLRTLLSLNDDHPPSVAFDLYIELLHLIWYHFQLSPEFRDVTYELRTSCAYVYANRMLMSLLCRQAQEANLLEIASKNIKEVTNILRKRLNPFEEEPDDNKDVILPSAASRWRTVIGGTLGVLRRNADTLKCFPQAATEMLKPLLDYCNMYDSSRLRGLEFLELTDYPKNIFNSPINNQSWSISMELLTQISCEQQSPEAQPIHFWLSVIKEGNLDFFDRFFLLLARYPVPPELVNSLTVLIEKTIEEKSFSKETTDLFAGAAKVLSRLTGEQPVGLRDRLIDHAIKELNNDHALWIDVCKMAFHLDYLKKPVQRVNTYIEVLEKISSVLSEDTREFGEFAVFIRRIESNMPPNVWPRLWRLLDR